ncbi:YeeE/YedE family protein [Serratia marcescens]|nr:YeeE/YedE family protein [Serratia marcescens]
MSMLFSLLIALILAFLIGWISQRMGMCLVKASIQLLAGRPALFIALTSCGLFGLMLTPLYRFTDNSLPLYSPGESYPLMVFGGGVFGVASVMNNGCSLGTLTKFACGDFNKLFTMVGWVLAIFLWYYVDAAHEKKIVTVTDISSGNYWALISIIALVLILLARVQGNKQLVLPSLLLGGLTSALYTFDPLWTPSTFFYKLSQFLSQENTTVTARSVAVFAMLMTGMLTFAIYEKKFCFEGFSPSKASVNLLAGVLMGAGASMMLGGNDSQILLVFPNLTVDSSIPLVSIVVGILVSLWCKKLGVELNKN